MIHLPLRFLSSLLAVALSLGASLWPQSAVANDAPAPKDAKGAAGLATGAPTAVKPADAAAEFFKQGVIPQIKILIKEDQIQKLRQDQRKYVECTILEDGRTTYKKVRVKLKGAAGSFRNFDDRPALTLNMDKKAMFHGLNKFHLNNSVQDESFISEWVCSQIIREAGYPATRVTHARVWINDRDLGFYVLKEGFDEEFLARNFANGKGNFYDGGFCQDIDAALEKDEGEGLDDRSDLKALIAACREGDEKKRWPMIQERLDVDMFLKFTALELMMCHWDGYAQNRNNYRVYFRGDDKKAVFMLHGLDQMFGDPNFSVFHVPGPIVTSGVLNNPEWRNRYREIVREMLPLFSPEKLNGQIDAAYKRMRPVVAAIHEDRAKHLDGRIQDFKSRIAGRQKAIQAQFPPEPTPFAKEGFLVVEGWEAQQVGDAKLEKKDVDGKKVFSIETGASKNCLASFRTSVKLGKGSYRFEAKVKTIGVTSITDATGQGAGIRISGGNRLNGNKAEGSADWQTISFPLEIAEDLREVPLVIELRSTAGTALFEAGSLRIVKAKP